MYVHFLPPNSYPSLTPHVYLTHSPYTFAPHLHIFPSTHNSTLTRLLHTFLHICPPRTPSYTPALPAHLPCFRHTINHSRSAPSTDRNYLVPSL
ncbi:hypothetical protein Pmani_032650 [Petrolisthes manimaculis]|uniref:Uncharacterized protein n=1 Tax=Petrolisthes manimaculis TaxID=1843537 RepID=A0AAE1NSL8_9EUCA|nr:hypothetical protein Pmani_032650 [Petrolisthes manimaculis]